MDYLKLAELLFPHIDKTADVLIEDGAWLTVHIFVLPGVLTPQLVIGAKAMIMGGSVISSSVPPRAMMQGNPAKKRGELL